MKTKRTMASRLAPVAFAVVLSLGGGAVSAQQAGQVEFARGVGFAQSPGQAPRTLGQGLPLREGDRLTTSDNSFAIVKLQDGSKITVRPNSELVLAQFRFREEAPDNSMVMQLIRGGFRAITGLITKNSPNAARVQTNTATIGIRGTDFDARLCAADCRSEAVRAGDVARPNTVQASARLVSTDGEVFAVNASGQRRRLVDGGSVFPGDTVETGPSARTVLVFRDESRISLGASARFRVDNFVYDDKNAADGRFLVSVLRGSARFLTGVIAKANSRNVAFSTATATVGIRGSGGVINVDDNGALREIFAFLGALTVQGTGLTALQVLQAGQGFLLTPQGAVPITTMPGSDAPDPQNLQPPPNLFSTGPLPSDAEGLFIYVRDGHIEVVTASGVTHLGIGELGFAGPNGQTFRPSVIPPFVTRDPVPMPNSSSPALVDLLISAGIRPGNICQ